VPDIEPIPEAVLEAAAVKMCRRLAALAIAAMAESGTNYELVEKRCGKRKNWARKLIDSLITGEGADGGVTLDDVSDFFFACDGAMLQFSVERKAESVAPMEAPTE
jgi:hypothetical protein